MENSDISKAFNGIVNMIKEFGGAAKLYGLIKAEETKKQELYYKLGKKYYSLFKDCPEKDLRPIVDKLIACDEKIAKLKEELSDPGKDYRDVEVDTGDDEEAGSVKENAEEKGAGVGTCEEEKAAETAEEIRESAADKAEEIRESAADKAEEIRESAADKAEEIHESTAEAADKVRESAEELRRTLSEDLDSGEPKQE